MSYKLRVGSRRIKRVATVKDVMSDAHIRKVAKKVVLGNIESKLFDTNAIALGVSAIGDIYDMSDIIVGDTSEQRTGQYVRYQKYEMRMTTLSGLTGSSYVMRIIFFRWHPKDNVAPIPIDILLINTGGGGDTHNVTADYNFNARENFTILKDMMVCPHNNSNGNMAIHTKINLKNSKVQYGQAGTDGINKVFMLIIANSPLVNFPTVNWYSRLWFKDA